MARLSHPNVVTVYDVGMWGGQPYLAMEYVKGQTLDEWGRTPGGRDRRPREILAVMAAAARGLEAAHAAGIVHRDVKPQNVLVADGRVLVTDFGLSVRDDRGARELWPGRALLFTWPPNSSPATRSTPATDVFGLCVTLYEMLYGLHPFGGGSGDVRRAACARTAGRCGHAAGPGRARHVQRLMLAGLAVDPAARPTGWGPSPPRSSTIRRAADGGWARRCWPGVRSRRVLGGRLHQDGSGATLRGGRGGDRLGLERREAATAGRWPPSRDGGGALADAGPAFR